jgi:hypothetical protein
MPDFHATPFNDLTETHLTSLIVAQATGSF